MRCVAICQRATTVLVGLFYRVDKGVSPGRGGGVRVFGIKLNFVFGVGKFRGWVCSRRGGVRRHGTVAPVPSRRRGDAWGRGGVRARRRRWWRGADNAVVGVGARRAKCVRYRCGHRYTLHQLRAMAEWQIIVASERGCRRGSCTEPRAPRPPDGARPRRVSRRADFAYFRCSTSVAASRGSRAPNRACPQGH